MPHSRSSSLHVEHLIREVVGDVSVLVAQELASVGYVGPQRGLALCPAQEAFLAGYLHGAVVRMLGFGEAIADADVLHATERLHRALFGPFDLDGRMRHAALVREGVDGFRNPQVYLGYCAGHHDAVRTMASSDAPATLGRALADLGRPSAMNTAWN